MLKPLYNKVAGLQVSLQISVEVSPQEFSYEYCETLKNTYFEKHLWMSVSDDGDIALCILLFGLRLQISPLILSEFTQINYFYFIPMRGVFRRLQTC